MVSVKGGGSGVVDVREESVKSGAVVKCAEVVELVDEELDVSVAVVEEEEEAAETESLFVFARG